MKYFLWILLLVAPLALSQDVSSVPPDTVITEADLFSQIGRMNVQINALLKDKQNLVATIKQLDEKARKMENSGCITKKP